MIKVLIFFVINSIIVSIITLRSYDISKKYNFLDHPSKGKIHSSPIPFIGGIIIYILLLGCFSLNFFVNLNINLYLFFYLSAFFILGFIDDRFDLNSNYKILSVILISLILIYFDESFLIHKIFFEISNNEFYFGHFKIPITIICILLLYIALNMSDGINCLLISFTIIALIIVNIFVLKRDLGFMDISLLSSLGTLLYFNYRNIYLFINCYEKINQKNIEIKNNYNNKIFLYVARFENIKRHDRLIELYKNNIDRDFECLKMNLKLLSMTLLM